MPLTSLVYMYRTLDWRTSSHFLLGGNTVENQNIPLLFNKNKGEIVEKSAHTSFEIFFGRENRRQQRKCPKEREWNE